MVVKTLILMTFSNNALSGKHLNVSDYQNTVNSVTRDGKREILCLVTACKYHGVDSFLDLARTAPHCYEASGLAADSVQMKYAL